MEMYNTMLKHYRRLEKGQPLVLNYEDNENADAMLGYASDDSDILLDQLGFITTTVHNGMDQSSMISPFAQRVQDQLKQTRQDQEIAMECTTEEYLLHFGSNAKN